ncbi:hypothetical protein, partial [Serratia marcescens]|uniref:hypothetical protein n=1 Tax=Serratia marcescens TaxID=615 RepID=UPI001F3EF9F1
VDSIISGIEWRRQTSLSGRLRLFLALFLTRLIGLRQFTHGLIFEFNSVSVLQALVHKASATAGLPTSLYHLLTGNWLMIKVNRTRF